MLAVLQLDALSRTFVDQLLGEGRLPTLAGLVARGEWRSLETPASHFTGATQPTLYSGIELGTHAQYYILQWSPQEQRIRSACRSTRRRRRGIAWRGQGGARSRSIPTRGTPSRSVRRRRVGRPVPQLPRGRALASPRAAGRTIDGLIGRRRPYVEEVFGRPHVPSLLKLRRKLGGAPGRLADAALGLLAEGSFDLVWLTFLSCHIGGHQFWNLSQLDEDALDEPTKRLLEGTLGELYEDVDRGLGRVLNGLPEDADVIVASPLGMARTRAARTSSGRCSTPWSKAGSRPRARQAFRSGGCVRPSPRRSADGSRKPSGPS